MTKPKNDLTAADLREMVHYDPETGAITWFKSGSGRRVGGAAGYIYAAGYVRTMIRGRWYKGHRLAWLWMTGEWPEFEIDHINLDKADNRWLNLREATHWANGLNRLTQSNNTSGYKGVDLVKGAWRSRAKFRGKEIHLGLFDTREDAAMAHATAAYALFGEFVRPHWRDLLADIRGVSCSS
jgi:hypothetical protein